MAIKIAIVGYGNVGKSIERIALKDEDFEVVGVYSRREGVKSAYGSRVLPQSALYLDGNQDIDVCMLAVGSAFDLVGLAEKIATRYNTVDSFDTHARMREYVGEMNVICRACDTLSFIGCGWDPGLFSLERALLNGILTRSIPQTFWGKGVSQGHSEAVRKLRGVKYATQYTIPVESAVKEAIEGRTDFKPCEKHTRVCYVTLDYAGFYGKAEREVTSDERTALERLVRSQIVTMPNYFADYATTVHFVSEEEYFKDHQQSYHSGKVIATGEEGGKKSLAEFSLNLDSNPDFTASVMLAYARANYKMWREGESGAKTVLDVPVKYLLKGEGFSLI